MLSKMPVVTLRGILRPLQVNIRKHRSQVFAVGISCCGAASIAFWQGSTNPTKVFDRKAAAISELCAVAIEALNDREPFGTSARVAQHVPVGTAVRNPESTPDVAANLETFATSTANEFGSTAPSCEQRGYHLPIGFVLYPVMPWPLPVVGFVNVTSLSGYLVNQTSCNKAASMSDEPKAAGEMSSAPASVEHAHRTVSSRRQRRRERERMLANSAKVDAVVPCDINLEIRLGSVDKPDVQLYEEDSSAPAHEKEKDIKFWPATPESTPPQSPRANLSSLEGVMVPDELDVSDLSKLSDTQLSNILSQVPSYDAGLRRRLLEQLGEHFWSMSLDPRGCRIVQTAVELAEHAQRNILVEQLRGHVVEAAESPFANHVLQKCIEFLPTERLQFAIAELYEFALRIAKNRYGCRVLEQVMKHFQSEQTSELVWKLLAHTDKLCRHVFGNFVIQSILEHGTLCQRQHVAMTLSEDAVRLSKHRVASHVMKAAMRHCSPEDRQLLMNALATGSCASSELTHHHCASFVMREVRRKKISANTYESS